MKQKLRCVFWPFNIVSIKETILEEISIVSISIIHCFGLVFQILLDRTGYTLDVTTGQRKYGGPPPESVYTGAQPTVGTEVIHIKTVALML